jgi:hypothetical protein
MDEVNKKEVERLISELKNVLNTLEIVIARLEKIAGITEVEVPPEHLQKALRLCWLVKEKGGVISKDDLRQLGMKVGYDPRGLGGLYVGKNPWLVEIAGGKVALTQKAMEIVEKYREWLENQT